jgi:hypothetical protein
MNVQRMFWLTIVAATVWSLVMFWEATEFKKRDCSGEQGNARLACKYTSPIAALELATDPQMFRDRIDQRDPKANEVWNVEIARVNTCMDFLFIALYCGVFFLLAQLQSRWATVLVALFISLAAAFDIAENVRLLQALRGVVLHESQFPVPGFVSEAKWSLFAIYTLILGFALLVSKKPWPIVMSILMFGSAASTAAGISHLVLLVPAIVLLFITFVIAILYYFPFGPLTWEGFLVWVEFGYLIRFQLISALLLAVVLPACYFLFPSIFIGLFDALGFRSFVLVVAASLQSAWTVMITSRLVLVYGPDRFPSIKTLRATPSGGSPPR